jgi:HEAT repeat protein
VLDSLLRHKFFDGGLVDVIANFGSPAVEPLIKALQDERTDDRAAEALGKIGDKRAIEPLIAVLPRSEPAQWALERLTGQRFGRNQARWRAWWTKQQAPQNRQ